MAETFEKEITTRIEVGDNAYEVRFTRMTSWSGGWHPSDLEVDEDYPERIEVLLGNTWVKVEDINASTRSDIEGAVANWLEAYDNAPEVPEYITNRHDPDADGLDR